MQLGIFAKTFVRANLEQTLDAVAGHGLTQVQFNMSCVDLPTLADKLDEGSCVWIAQMLHERGLTMAAISGTFNMVDPNEARLEHNLHRLEVLAAACRWLDTRIITLCTGSCDARDMWKWHCDNARKSTWDRLLETMRAAVKIADRHEVTLAFEPEINNVVSSTMRARRLLDEVNSPWLKVVIDPANLVHAGGMGQLIEILNEAFDWIGSDIVLAHAKDPVLNEADQKALESMKQQAQSRAKKAVLRALWEAATAREVRETISKTPLRRVLEVPSFHFYWPYFNRLERLNYRGAVIIHGLAEEEVSSRIALLLDTLKPIVREGETDAGATA